MVLQTVLDAENVGGPYEYFVAGYEKQAVNKYGAKDAGYIAGLGRINLCFKIQTKARVTAFVNGKDREFPKHQYILNVHVNEVHVDQPKLVNV